MYLVQTTKEYEKSYVRLLRSGTKESVFDAVKIVVNKLSDGEKLEAKYSDHKLHGEYSGYRECHIMSDLLLIYQIREEQLVLVLINIGSHSYLFE